jgi:hypothetical protein
MGYMLPLGSLIQKVIFYWQYSEAKFNTCDMIFDLLDKISPFYVPSEQEKIQPE